MKPLTAEQERWLINSHICSQEMVGDRCRVCYLANALAAECKHADELAGHMRQLQDCGYEFHSPDNRDRVDALLEQHAARRAKEVANGK